MTITIKHDGIEYSVPTPAEAVALARELKKADSVAPPIMSEKPAIKASSTVNGSTNEGGPAIDFDPEVVGRALKFLKVIREGASKGVQSDVMMGVFGVNHPKAIGSRSGAVNRLLTDLGFTLATVYKNPRTPTGRVWRPGRQMTQAISTLEQRLAAH